MMLGVGDPAPPLVALADDGRDVLLTDWWAEAPVVAVFLRHFGCPICRQHLVEVQKHAGAFAKLGARLVAIGQGTGEEAAAMAEKLDLDFPCLGDPEHAGYRALGLGSSSWWGLTAAPFLEDPRSAFRNLRQADLAASANPRTDVKQLGGVVIVGRGGKIEYLYRSTATTDLPEISELLAALGDSAT